MRKGFVKKLVCALMAAVVFSGICLCGCGSNGKDTLVISIYGNYFSDEAVKMFEEENNCTVNLETFEESEEMYQKLTNGAVDYDLICTGDYMIERLIQENYLLKIDLDNVPGVKNLNEIYTDKSRNFDPNLEYTIPHFWGTLGILYNTEKVDPNDAKSWKVLWNEKYSGRIYMIESARDILVPALTILGYDINTTDEKQIDEAKQMLIEQAAYNQGYSVDDTRNQIAAGNADIGVIYSGESYNAIQSNSKLAYVIPEEGSNIWIDSWVIPNTCRNKALAEKFLDFCCRKEVAQLNFNIDCYPTPNQLLYDSLDDELKNDRCIFPDEESIARCQTFHYTGEEAYALYDNTLSDIRAAAHK